MIDFLFGLGLRLAMWAVKDARNRNADVFIWPTEEWSALYTVEEITEFMRYVQRLKAPDHLRGNGGDIDKDNATLEWGQALMMWLTIGIQMHINPGRALKLALVKIWKRSEKERGRRNGILEKGKGA